MISSEIISVGADKLKCLINSDEIRHKVDLLANKIRTDMGEEENPLFICVLKGAFMFASDLLKAYKGSCELEFIRLSSYNGTKSLGKVKKLMGMDFEEVRERRVVIIEDIVDTGLTIRTLLGHLAVFKPKSVDIASLFVKPARLCHDVTIKYYCFEIPDAFIVGYGLDYDEKYRNLPAIYVIQK